ncbi:MAG TPA: hypothetical protein DEQ40_00155 [Oxalobacteraceae bacterium]|nr:hypothetical protein [Oxalobacteraceae bacterium]
MPIQENTAPAIGQQWPGQGGIYAGLSRGRDGTPDYHLIVGPELTAAAWGNAKQQAAALVIDDHADFTLPFRAEQSLLFANVPELFKKDWYWSCEQLASGPDYAWMQNFVTGDQGDYRKSYELRARAVRRLKISQNPAQA